MEKIMKKIVSLAMALFVLTSVFAFSLPVLAGTSAENNIGWGGDTIKNNASNAIGLGNRDPRVMIASIINVALSFLGIIAVVIILIGGFKWMTAGGNEEKTGEAKKLIAAGAIGLVIILAAWAIATFVLTQLINATTLNT